MRTRPLIVLGLTAFLVGGGSAVAGEDIRLEGEVEEGGATLVQVSDAKLDGTKMRRYRWRFEDLAVDCSGVPAAAKLPVTGGFYINAQYDKPGPWGVQGESEGNGNDPDYAAEVSGRLVSKRKAKGWVRVYGNEVPLADGSHGDCDSGRLRWVARD